MKARGPRPHSPRLIDYDLPDRAKIAGVQAQLVGTFVLCRPASVSLSSMQTQVDWGPECPAESARFRISCHESQMAFAG